MDRITLLSAFVLVSEMGSFSKAASQLRLTQSQVSKMIQRLEEELHCTLFIRTTRSLKLTEEGERFVTHAKVISDNYASALEEVHGNKAEPKGCLRVLTSDCTGRTLFIHHAANFLARYPMMRIDHVVRDTFTNLVENQIDVALCVGALPDSSYRTKHLGEVSYMTVAAPAYLKTRGIPETPQALQQHDCIIFSKLVSSPAMGGSNTWHYTDNMGKPVSIEVNGRYSVDNSSLAWRASLLGLGVFQGPKHLLAEDVKAGRLVEILAGYKMESFPVQLIYPAQTYMPLRLRSFIDFFVSEFNLDSWSAA